MGNIDIVRILLEDGRADPNKEDKSEFLTSFDIACMKGHVDIVKLLLDEGVINQRKRKDYQDSLFYFACAYSEINIIKILLDDSRISLLTTNEDRMEGLLIACHHARIDIVKFLIETEQVDLSQPSFNGRTPLMTAFTSYRYAYDVIKFLLKCDGIDIHQTDHSARTAFYLMCKNDNIDIVEYMLSECDDIIIPDEIFSDAVEKILGEYR